VHQDGDLTWVVLADRPRRFLAEWLFR